MVQILRVVVVKSSDPVLNQMVEVVLNITNALLVVVLKELVFIILVEPVVVPNQITKEVILNFIRNLKVEPKNP